MPQAVIDASPLNATVEVTPVNSPKCGAALRHGTSGR